MSTLNMVNDLVGQGFHVLHGQFSLVPQKCKKSIKRLLNKGTPILACKQWSSNPLYGHFVVIIGLMGDQITYLNPELNSQPQTQNVQQFLTEWQATGQEVIGGQFITMGKDPLPLSINRLHLTQFNVPTKLKDFCLEAVTFTP